MTTLNRSRVQPVLLIVAAIVALIILAAGFSQFQLTAGEAFPYQLIFRESTPTSSSAEALPGVLPATLLEFITMLGLFLLTVVLILWLIVFLIRPEARKRMLQRIVYYLFLLLVLHTVLGYIRELQPLENLTNGAGIGALGELAADEPAPEPPSFVVNPPQWLVFVMTFAIVSLLLVALWLLFRRRGQAPPEFAEETPMMMLAQEAEDTLIQLQQGANFKESVLGCYQAMTHILQEERGIRRGRAMTPRDFEAHLQRVGLTDSHIRRLTHLFEQVRYGFGEPAARDEKEAVDCLTAIVQTYSRAT